MGTVSQADLFGQEPAVSPMLLPTCPARADGLQCLLVQGHDRRHASGHFNGMRWFDTPDEEADDARRDA